MARPAAPRALSDQDHRGQSAVIVRVDLPEALERLRRRSVADAVDGLPAHATLLYPFVAPDELNRDVRATLVSIARDHPVFEYALTGPALWPDLVHAAIDPAEHFVAIHRDLARTFPDYPIYGQPAGFELIPHATVAEGASAADPSLLADAAWATLPVRRTAAALEVIASDDAGRWRLVWRLPLGLQSADAADVPPV